MGNRLLTSILLTMTLVAGIGDADAGVASSMFNAGQQVGGAVGLAVIGSVAWTVVLAGGSVGNAFANSSFMTWKSRMSAR